MFEQVFKNSGEASGVESRAEKGQGNAAAVTRS